MLKNNSFRVLIVGIGALSLTSVLAQNYSECQAPDAHMNPNCNGSKPSKPAGNELRIGGTYSAQGTSPDGSKYEGTVVISGEQQSGFQFNWTIGADTYSGTGQLSGNTLTVEWGAPEPVVYKVTDGGNKLNGKWGKRGKGREKLVRQ